MFANLRSPLLLFVLHPLTLSSPALKYSRSPSFRPTDASAPFLRRDRFLGPSLPFSF
ncbi:hypothetical protein [Phormidium sp. CCY1219]|uniref:hypothetical protein n=1 Tax=Phormidium sp. CCY1219 TaxID=2886104 RepID=UPI002D1F6879|nr:hypothetical protein [Phormidium sp. CCY1219]MEB3827444.1 hypothetical protein [Phormidium sp. CCY1219]